MKMKDIFELIEAVDYASNVKSIAYNKDEENWTISYKNDIEDSKIDTTDLVDFLYNG